MSAEKKQAKFIAMGTVLAVAIAAVVGFTVWFAYHSSQVADASLRSANKVSSDIPKVAAVTDFASCQKAPGSIIQQTYPEQCVTKGGKSFTDTAQPKYLVIKEWGVEVAYSGTDQLSYAVNPGGAVSVISHNLATNYGCTTFGAGNIGRQLGTAQYIPGGNGTDETVTQAYASNPATFTKLGAYYYSFGHDQAACATDPTKASAAAENAANLFVQALIPKLTTVK